MEIGDLLNDVFDEDEFDQPDSPEEREMMRQAKAAIDLWVRARLAQGATPDDLRREMEAMCDVADLQVLAGAKLGRA